MPSFTIGPLSESVSGKNIAIGASPGTLVHTGSSVAKAVDEISMSAINASGAVRTVTVCWGGSTNADKIEVSVPPSTAPVSLVKRMLLSGPLEILVFSDIENTISITGEVLRTLN